MTAPPSPSAAVLSAFTEEDSAFLKSLASESMSPTEAGSGFLKSPTAVPEATVKVSSNIDALHAFAKFNDALQAAALLGAFDPIGLIPGVDESGLKRLLAECTVSTDGLSSRWSMRAATRERLLAQMASDPGGLARGIEGAKGYLERSGESADDVTQTLFAIASGNPPRQQDLSAMSKEVLAANRAVVGWLQSIDTQLGFDATRLLGAIELAELLEPFRFLTGCDPKTGDDTFVGRLDELRQLRAFVDSLRAESVLESVHRTGRRWVGNDRRILGFSGVGGVGKSTLLSKFILQHVASDSDAPLRFAYLDFDRSTISAVQPVTLLLELTRQLGWQAPELRRELDDLRSRIREEVEGNRATSESRRPPRVPNQTSADLPEPGEPELPEELIGPSLLSSYLHETGQILSRGQLTPQPLLLVLDTFEEAQVLGDEAVRRVEGLVEACQEHLPLLRSVIVGRDAVAGFFEGAERLVVSEFKDLASRTAFLEKRGLSNALAKAVARQVGGRPLALLLAARLVRDQGLDAISVSLTERFRGLFNKYLIDGVLYQRILQHIDDDDVRALAHPGLVLRRIDVDVLRQVVAPVLGLGEISAERAGRTLSALRLQKDLVRSEADGSVTHRADVREQMLVLMNLEKPDIVRALHVAASEYYAARQPVTADVEQREKYRIEEIYHRLSIGDSLERMPDLWFTRARLGLARSVDELENVAGRGTLKVLLGRIPNEEEVRALPDIVLREYTSRALGAAIQLPDPDRALSILAEFPKQVDSKLRRSVEPRALDLSGQWASARSLFVKLVDEQGTELSISDALAAADFFERVPGRERYRDVMHGLVVDLYGRQMRLSKSGSWLAPLKLAALKLGVRSGQYGNGRPSREETELDAWWRTTSAAGPETLNTDQQWTMTLTSEVDRSGTRPVETLSVTDTVRGQLAYLRSLLADDTHHSQDVVIALEICDELARSRTIGALIGKRFAGPAQRDVLARVLRHLVRPQTPQWYAPIACLIRREFGESVRSADLYDESLPELPFRPASTIRTIRALADYLGRLDQLGVLHTCLERRVRRRTESNGSQAEVSVAAFLEWRNAMLFDIDGWFASFERIRKLSVGSKAS